MQAGGTAHLDRAQFMLRPPLPSRWPKPQEPADDSYSCHRGPIGGCGTKTRRSGEVADRVVKGRLCAFQRCCGGSAAR